MGISVTLTMYTYIPYIACTIRQVCWDIMNENKIVDSSHFEKVKKKEKESLNVFKGSKYKILQTRAEV